MRPLPQFSYEPQRASEPPPETDDETTIFEEPSDDSDDDSETLVLVRDKLSIPKKQP